MAFHYPRQLETGGSRGVREHPALQLAPAPAKEIEPRKMVRCYSSEGRRLAHDLSETDVLRKERLFKLEVKRVNGRIVSARELPPNVRLILDQRDSGLFRVRFTEIDRDADERTLRWRLRHKRAA